MGAASLIVSRLCPPEGSKCPYTNMTSDPKWIKEHYVVQESQPYFHFSSFYRIYNDVCSIAYPTVTYPRVFILYMAGLNFFSGSDTDLLVIYLATICC